MAAAAVADGRREGRALTQEMVFMRTKCNRMDLIKNLNLWGNDLQDISVIQSMPNLEVLSLSVNHVSTLVDLQYCPKLSELYLRKNEIMDLSEILYLRHLRRMKVLWLADNPCADLPYYRSYILHHLPGLTKIDAEDVTEEERKEAQLLDFGGMDTLAGCEGDPFSDRAEQPATAEVSGRGHFRSAPAVPTLSDADLLEPRLQNADRRRGYSVTSGQRPPLAWGDNAPRPELPVSNGRTADSRGQHSNDNVLCAVLALVKELDRQGLDVVRRAVEQRMAD